MSEKVGRQKKKREIRFGFQSFQKMRLQICCYGLIVLLIWWILLRNVNRLLQTSNRFPYTSKEFYRRRNATTFSTIDCGWSSSFGRWLPGYHQPSMRCNYLKSLIIQNFWTKSHAMIVRKYDSIMTNEYNFYICLCRYVIVVVIISCNGGTFHKKLLSMIWAIFACLNLFQGVMCGIINCRYFFFSFFFFLASSLLRRHSSLWSWVLFSHWINMPKEWVHAKLFIVF